MQQPQLFCGLFIQVQFHCKSPRNRFVPATKVSLNSQIKASAKTAFIRFKQNEHVTATVITEFSPSPHSLKDERCSKRIRHSLRSCRLCRFFLLLLRDIDHADEVPPDDQGLLFCPCAGDFFRFLHLDLLHERANDLCGKFRNVRVPAHHSQEGIYIQSLLPSLRKYAVIIDEAHSSQSGENNRQMRKALSLEEATQQDAEDEEANDEEKKLNEIFLKENGEIEKRYIYKYPWSHKQFFNISK